MIGRILTMIDRWQPMWIPRFLHWCALGEQTPCPYCGKPLSADDAWAEIMGEVWHGECVLAKWPQ